MLTCKILIWSDKYPGYSDTNVRQMLGQIVFCADICLFEHFLVHILCLAYQSLPINSTFVLAKLSYVSILLLILGIAIICYTV